MKLNAFNLSQHRPVNRVKHAPPINNNKLREPLKTYDEVAEMFGTDAKGLHRIRKSFDIPFPEPATLNYLSNGFSRTQHKAYYIPAEVKRWVSDVKAKFGLTTEQIKGLAKMTPEQARKNLNLK
jgi:hypothetical protein